MATATAGTEVVWAPLPGSQTLFLTCPVFEALYEGTRGCAKTDALLMDFAQHTGQGYGVDWRGVLFRQTYKQLDDVVARSRRWFHRIFPAARFNESDYTWRWPDGEELLLRYMEREADYWNYHGHEYPWIGWEELTAWAEPTCYDMMKSCSRSRGRGMPRKYRATTNPWGVGHNWVKARFIDPMPPGVVAEDEQHLERVRVHGHWSENTALLEADPDYPRKLAADADPNRRAAWLEGSWDIVAGGMFDDVWRRERHVLQPFAIPASWYVDRSFDWGSAKPFSVGWWAESDGTAVTLADGRSRTFPRGSLIRIAEWYGWNGQPNTGSRSLAVDVARGIKLREVTDPVLRTVKVRAGPADTSIFDAEDGVCIADNMAKEGIRWLEADKGPGTRANGWERLRQMLKAAGDGNREEPGLWVFDTCSHFIRTVPTLPRDERKPDDVNTKAEDHVGDETRYRIMQPKRVVQYRPAPFGA